MFTDKYIKMCDTPEIQEGWKPEVGDRYHVRETNRTCIALLEDVLGNWFEARKGHFIFLPLQHQLQEMFFNSDRFKDMSEELKLSNPYIYNNRFGSFISRNWQELDNQNELSLAHLMEELYQKKWNNIKGVWADV